jgi:hypothetical protein
MSLVSRLGTFEEKSTDHWPAPNGEAGYGGDHLPRLKK